MVLALAVALALGIPAPAPSPGVDVIPLTLPSGHVFQTEVMVKPPDRARGLMGRDALAPDRAMLFVFDEADFHGIWMKNCRFPIDIVWLDEGARVVHVAEAVPACRKDPCPVYEPMQRAAFVVELNAGAARKEGALVGTVLRFTLPTEISER